jgi:hypothetical protein
MTNQHPATPTSQEIDKFFMLPLSEEERLSAAFCAGADRQLEACLRYAGDNGLSLSRMRATLRPKPPNLKQQALNDLSRLMSKQIGMFDGQPFDNILAALEQLPDDTTP